MSFLISKRIFTGLLALVSLSACAGTSRSESGQSRVGIYPISAALHGDGPKLVADQRAWVDHVLAMPKYAKQREHLRFADIRGIRTPLIVYVDQPSEPNGYHFEPLVIGEGCDVAFNPLHPDEGAFAIPGPCQN